MTPAYDTMGKALEKHTHKVTLCEPISAAAASLTSCGCDFLHHDHSWILKQIHIDGYSMCISHVNEVETFKFMVM